MATFLLGVESLGGGSQESVLKKLLVELNEIMDVVATSSIYQIFDTESLDSGKSHPRLGYSEQGHLGVVFKAQSQIAPLQLSERFHDIELAYSTAPRQKYVQLTLLAYENHTMMHPRLTLPCPNLHRQAKKLIPAAEAWPSYTHPILKQTLGELVGSVVDGSWGQFYAQGKAILDYSPQVT
jgi:7,8-dihydro-6-hydroxymethylpterin-pyrophosphokinase